MATENAHSKFAKSDRKFWLKAGAVTALGIASFVACTTALSGGPDSGSSGYEGSLGAAEVACERAIENTFGRDAKVSEYFSAIEDGPGDFELRGQLTTSSAGSKFLCTITGATDRATDATATVELYG